MAQFTASFRTFFVSPQRALAALLLAACIQLAVPTYVRGQDSETSLRSAKDLLQQGAALQRQGTAESLGKAREKFEEAAKLFHSANDDLGEAMSLNNIGGVYDVLGPKQEALEYFQRAFPLAQKANDVEGQMMTLHNIAGIYDAWGQKDKALDYYNQSQKLAEAGKQTRAQVLNYNNIGGLYSSWGEKKNALDYFQRALGLAALGHDTDSEVLANFNIGSTYADLGNEQRGMYFFRNALERAQGRSPAPEAAILNGIGRLYDDAGDPQKAMEYYQKALPLRQAAGDPNGLAVTMNSICRLQDNYGQHQIAEQCWQEILKIVRTTTNQAAQVAVLNNLGMLYDRAGDKDQALEQYNAALVIARQLVNRESQVVLLNNIGRVFDTTGKKQAALDKYEEALPIAAAVGDRSAEANLLVNRAGIERDRSNLREAQADLETAITLVEFTRSKVAGQDLRASYLQSIHGFYELYVEVLMRANLQQPNAGFDRKALEASERGRARSLLEILAEGRTDIRQGVSTILLQRERDLQALLDSKSDTLRRVLATPVTVEKAEALKKEIGALLEEYKTVEIDIRVASPRYAALTQPQPLSSSQIQQLLDPDTLLLEYSLGAEASYLWAVGSEGVKAYTLPDRRTIETQARELYANLTQLHPVPREEVYKITSQLSTTLLGKVAAQLGRKRLVIVADGALTYIPFSVLSAHVGSSDQPQQPLILDHEIVYLPSASALSILRTTNEKRTPAPKLLAILADPVFSVSDKRLGEANSGGPKAGTANQTQSFDIEVSQNRLRRLVQDTGANEDGSFRRLQHSREEADGIASLAPESQLLKRLDFSASKTMAISGELAQYRIVHFATHGLMNSEQPDLSGVVLSLVDRQGSAVDGVLRLQDIFGMTLNADLAVLSACETALGKNMRGEGLVGLTRGFMYAGVPRVAVSLWKVDDESTAELMRRFYDGMLSNKLSPAAAMKAAQTSMWNDTLNPRWSAPYFWAAFTVQGEWK
jgi:CHAT domain-containing protein/Tfp pilus assembly protein PilF